MKSEGMKRLSCLVGALGALAWITFIVIVIFQEGFRPPIWLIIVCGLVISFLLPFGITKGIAWVIDGFKQD